MLRYEHAGIALGAAIALDNMRLGRHYQPCDIVIAIDVLRVELTSNYPGDIILFKDAVLAIRPDEPLVTVADVVAIVTLLMADIVAQVYELRFCKQHLDFMLAVSKVVSARLGWHGHLI